MKITKLTPKSRRWPPLLREINAPPKQLYVCGQLTVDMPLIAIVGSRKHTGYGATVTEQLSTELAAAGVGIISGLALGIDAIAHRGCLAAHGYTIAVMARGLDQIYPSTHRALAEQIVASGGALISEYPAGMPPLKQHFPARNRLVSGLAQAVLVTECAQRSGALITAHFALDQNRLVCTVPGPITSSYSVGTNNLIKAGAIPVTSAQDVMLALGWTPHQPPAQPHISGEAAEVLSLIDSGISDSNELCRQLDWEMARLQQLLTLLEITGEIRNLGSGQWVRVIR